VNDQTNRFVRSARLVSGLVLFSYVTSHFFNHALGIRSLSAMEAGSTILLFPWQTYVGLSLLYLSFLLHGCLGLFALLKRRHLRMPVSEAFQLGTGLTIPLLLIPHAAGVRLGYSLQGLEFGYGRLLYQFWVVSPDFVLPRQILLLLIVWVHGCIGLRSWLRAKRWYPRAVPALASLATLVPVLAVLGLIVAGLNIREAAQRGELSVTLIAADGETVVDRIVEILLGVYVGAVAIILLLRVAMKWHARRFSAIRITYPGGRIVSVQLGFTVLEASRWAGIAHESVCGGRGRCSTCRIRILQGAERLPAPDELESRNLGRLGATPDIRLACQLRPRSDLTIEPLVRPRALADGNAIRFDAAVGGSKEIEIAAMFVDLWGSTELATGRLPYDALYLFDRYVQVVSGAIRAHKGHVTSVAGDGIMSVFSMDAGTGARSVLRSVLDIWTDLDKLNIELSDELPKPLKVGIGIHVGTAVVGWVSDGVSQSLQFLGDTGNVAAKLERYTRTLQCTLVVSEAALLAAGISLPFEKTAVRIAGRNNLLPVALVKQRADLERLLVQMHAT
jgi:adenylate cyclase